MKAKEYWRRRAEQYESEWQGRIQAELEPELAKFYKSALQEIEKDILALYAKYGAENGLTYAEAKKLIRGKEFSEWRMTVAEYVAVSHANSKMLKELNTLSMRSRISRLEKLYSETLMELQKLGEKSEGAVKDFLTTAYKERYTRGVYDLAKVGKLEIPVAKAEPAKLEKVLSSRWEGGNYSSRIWKNTEKLSQVIKETLSQGLHRGLNVPKMTKAIESKMGAGYKNAERLVRTEMNFVQNYAAKESLEAAGLEEYEFIAVLDHRTTPRCQALDGTTHLLIEYSPGTNAPPMHPRCRSTISALVEGGKRTAKVKGKNISVPREMTYADYKRVYLDKAESFEKWNKNKSSTLQKAEGNGKIQGKVTPFSFTPQQQEIKAAEKAAYTAVTGANFGFNKMKTEPKWDKEIYYSNGDGKGAGRKMNCQCCAIAHEARMRGLDVTACENWGSDDTLQTVESLLSVFEKAELLKLSKSELKGDIIKAVENTIKIFGKGARAFIWFQWKDNPNIGHIIVAECTQNFFVNIGDPQSRKRAAACELNGAIPETIKIMRVDNLKFTENIKNFCMNRG